jgi:hypothetical protein
METVVMAITAAADKTTAAFFMGFPFTKIKRQAKAFCRLNPATLCPLLVPSRGTPNPNKKTASRKFVPAKYEIVNFMSAFDSGPSIQSRRLRNSKLGQGVRFHFLEGRFDMRDLRAVLDHGRAPAPSPAIATGCYWRKVPRISVVPASHEHTAAGIAPTIPKLRI